jgi:hypothetical protein
MQVISLCRAGVFGLSVLALVSCDESANFGEKSFKSQYSSARDALEKGKYEQANRVYLRLMPTAGALQPRLRLELAHSYLRSGNFAAAAKEARSSAGAQTGTGKAAALAVQATADHELGLKALARGDTSNGKGLLKQADTAMAWIIKKHPELDPVGALAGRRASIAVRLKSL